jgi:CheY-like chemotaxis protein
VPTAVQAGKGLAFTFLELRGSSPTMPVAKVLLVDANEDSRRALSRALVEAGYEVASASSGASASGALESERPDLVVSYAQIQDMDGYELFTLVRKDPTTMDTPFLLLAGLDRPVALAAAEAGVDVTMTGEFTLEMVVGQVGDVLKPGTGAGPSRRPAGNPAGNGAGKTAAPLWAAVEALASKPTAAQTRRDFQGSLDVMDLAEVTQAVALGGKTGRLVVELAAGEGVILFESGRVVHAGFRGRTGEQAFADIIVASQREADSRFSFSRTDRAEMTQGPRTISRSVEQLLLSIAVGIDEGEPGGTHLEDASSSRQVNG